jgi:hypothetical protein
MSKQKKWFDNALRLLDLKASPGELVPMKGMNFPGCFFDLKSFTECL